MNNSGYTLIEITSALFVSSIVIAGLATMIHLMSKTNVMSAGVQDTTIFQMETRNYLKKEKNSGESLCMDHFATRLNHAHLKQAVDDAELSLGLKKVELKSGANFLNFSDPVSNPQEYSNLHITKTELTDFKVSKRLTGYYTNTAYEFSTIGRTPRPVMYVLSSILKTTFARHGDLNSKPFFANVKVRLAVDVTDPANFRLVDCSSKSVARSTAFIESCKSFGDDFSYVYETSNNKGQCYMPVYDPVAAGLGASPTGNVAVNATGYTPLRGFLCEGVIASKTSTYPFCTGEF